MKHKRECVYIGGVYRLSVGCGITYKVLMRTGPLWRVVWMNGTGKRDDLATVQITACSRYLGGGQSVNAYED